LAAGTGTGSGERGNGDGPGADTQVDLRRSRTSENRGDWFTPLVRHQFGPRSTDHAARRGPGEFGERAVALLNPSAPIHDAEGQADGIGGVFPHVVTPVRRLDQVRPLESEGGDRRKALESPEISRRGLPLEQHGQPAKEAAATLDRDAAGMLSLLLAPGRAASPEHLAQDRREDGMIGLSLSTLRVTLLIHGDDGGGPRPEACLDFLNEAVKN
jgi:hypothetical protein